jgi:uncharacterized protein (TIGR03083 family)
MGVLVVDREHARVALATVAHRIAELLADGFDPSAEVPGLAWTVGDLVAHIAAESRSFAMLATSELTPQEMWDRFAPGTEHLPSSERMAVLNAAEIKAFDRTDLDRPGELIEAAVSDFMTATGNWPDAQRFHGLEGDLTPGTATTVMLFELLIHGADLARALGKRWEIPADHARLVVTGLTDILHDYLDAATAGATRATIDVRMRGGPRFVIWIHDGRLEVTAEPADSVDCHISADPVAFLQVSTGRRSQWSAVARGQLLAWGRRPWMAMRLTHLLQAP